VPDEGGDGARTNPKQLVSRHVEDFVRTEIGLPRPGENLPDVRTSTVTFRNHLQELLRCLTFGFAVFEQVYQVEVADGGTVVHLWKLASRPQKTIEHFLVDADGDLRAVVQRPLPGALSNSATGIVMPVETLVVYCHEREGADWSGTSILRNCYKNWLIKDVVLRLTAQIVERNGMGIPDVTYDEGGSTSKAEAVKLAQSLRAGAAAGMAHAADVKVQILGVTGNLVDAVPFLTYNDQQIAGSALAMFQTLGHDNGARALGDTFLDVFTNSLQAEGDYVAEQFTQQVIRPLVAANFGPDEPYPVLEAGDMTETGVLDAHSLNELVAAGLIEADDTLRAFFRTRYDLPVPDPKPEPLPPVVVVPPPPEAVARPSEKLTPPPKPEGTGGFSAPIADYATWLDARRAAAGG
jgi:phage gp29-like protein